VVASVSVCVDLRGCNPGGVISTGGGGAGRGCRGEDRTAVVPADAVPPQIEGGENRGTPTVLQAWRGNCRVPWAGGDRTASV
jgi:hypothetical protein